MVAVLAQRAQDGVVDLRHVSRPYQPVLRAQDLAKATLVDLDATDA